MVRSATLSGLLLLAALSGCKRTGHLERAQELAFHQDFKAALGEYEQALGDLGREESGQAHQVRAAALRGAADICYLHLMDYVKAAQLYRDLAERYPDRPETFEARANLADILRDHFHDTRGALAQLAALVQAFPNHLETDRYQYRAAQDYFALRDYAQTETEVRLFLKRWPGSGYRADAQMLLGSALAFQGRKPEAVEVYQQVSREHPGADAGRANLEIARLYEDGNEFDKAETYLAKALADYPEPKVVSLALQRVKRRVALQRPVDLHDRNAIFDHAAAQAAASPRESGGD